jgi:hypothetical protein
VKNYRLTEFSRRGQIVNDQLVKNRTGLDCRDAARES